MRWLAGPVALLLCSPATLFASDFRIEGASALGETAAAQAIRRYDLRLDAPTSGPAADDAAFYLAEELKGMGFPDAEVTWAIEGGAAVFRVVEGERWRLGHVGFSGGDGLSEDRRMAIVESAMRQATRTPVGPIPFVEEAIEVAKGRLEWAYASAGYIRASVAWEPSSRPPRRDVLFTIEQGPKGRVAKVEVTGMPETFAFDPALPIGSIYRPSAELEIKARVIEALRTHGYFEGRAGASAELADDGVVRIKVKVEPGRPFVLGGVSFDGLSRTRRSALADKLRLRPGTVFNQTAVDQALRRLWLTGAFSEIQPETTVREGGLVDLNLRFQEAPARQISATVGYGQWDRAFIQAEYSDRNILGSLNRFSLTGSLSTRNAGIAAALTDPFLLGTAASGTVSAYFNRKETPSYRSTFYGGALLVERVFEELGASVWRAGYEWKATVDTQLFAEDDLENVPSDYRLGILTFGQTLDLRNDPLTPMSGMFLAWDGGLASEALLGDLSFLRVRGQATAYFPLRRIEPERPLVPFIAVNTRGGALVPFGNTREVPVQERFFLGGPETVRSFQLDGMAPRNKDGVPLGGLFFAQANVELQFPVWRGLYAVGFLDVGNLATTLGDFNWGATRTAAGVGARFYTPLGAVRMDYGANLIRGQGDPLGAWQFGFGFTF
jgi:outer membrane protein assembly complex protein YaeT